MTDSVHEARRDRAINWLESLEEKGRDALIDWVQQAIETAELFDACCEDSTQLYAMREDLAVILFNIEGCTHPASGNAHPVAFELARQGRVRLGVHITVKGKES
jgi:hypothetical protein